MLDPEAIDPASFIDFIRRPGLTVVFMSLHPAHAFNRVLPEVFHKHGQLEVTYATIDVFELMLWASPLLPYLQRGLRACGAPSMFGVLPGYWLFCEGEVLAWESGLPSRADARALIPSAALASAWSGVTGSPALIADALQAAIEEPLAQRMAAAFKAAAEKPRARRSYARPRSGANDLEELIRAYRVLGVPPSATLDEVERAWRKRRAENHPDRAGDDPIERARRTRVSVELNQARDVIRAHRERAAA